MHVDDIDTATAIEEAAFGCELPQRDYHYELERNLLAHYFVLHVHPARLGLDQAATHTARSELIIGLGGFWLIGDSVHIMTIAVWPRWRGLGLGEWLLLTLLKEGPGGAPLKSSGNFTVSEVQVSRSRTPNCLL
jgi:ribosomal-protein-alanine N-acetyltransferase